MSASAIEELTGRGRNALVGLPFGGGKAVIIADARTAKTPELFAAFGRRVDALRGRYVTAEKATPGARPAVPARSRR